eukprot:1703759-Heterocapsa_arctica.AAC.1
MTGVSESEISAHLERVKPDLVFVSAGTPCQQLSALSTDQSGLDGDQSGKFWDFVRVLTLISELLSQARVAVPLFFLFENVVMKDCWLRPIEAALGHECVVIDAANFSLPPDVEKW